MGSSAGWKDVLTLGGYSSQRKMARAQEQAAQQYAAAAEKQAAAIEAANTATPQAVQATNTSTQQAAEAAVDSQAKRRRSMASTANTTYAKGWGGSGGKVLGNTGWGRTQL